MFDCFWITNMAHSQNSTWHNLVPSPYLRNYQLSFVGESIFVVCFLYLQLTIHSVEASITEHSDLFRTVTSHTFHNLSPATAYSVTITAVNKGKSGPPVSLNVTTQETPGDS